jgi:hypothetical protein
MTKIRTAEVTVDPDDYLTPASTVTVDGRTYPVPARCPLHGWVLWMHRVAEPLAAAGWRLVLDADRRAQFVVVRPGVAGVLVERKG